MEVARWSEIRMGASNPASRGVTHRRLRNTDRNIRMFLTPLDSKRDKGATQAFASVTWTRRNRINKWRQIRHCVRPKGISPPEARATISEKSRYRSVSGAPSLTYLRTSLRGLRPTGLARAGVHAMAIMARTASSSSVRARFFYPLAPEMRSL